MHFITPYALATEVPELAGNAARKNRIIPLQLPLLAIRNDEELIKLPSGVAILLRTVSYSQHPSRVPAKEDLQTRQALRLFITFYLLITSVPCNLLQLPCLN